jgi:hypothetical protein
MTPHPFPRLATKAGVIALLFMIVAGAYGFVAPGENKTGWGFFGNDLMPSYAAGAMVRDGHAGDIYNPYAVKRVVRETWTMCYPGEPARKGLAPWLNPPAYVLPFAALARLSYPHAMFVWIGVNVMLTALSCVMLMKLLPAHTPRSVRLLVPILVLTSFPYLQATCHQQNTFLSLFILTSTLMLALRALGVRAPAPLLSYATGLVAGFLFFKPQLGLVVALALTVVLGYRAFVGAVLTGTLLLSLGEWTLPGATWEFLLQMPETVRLVQERQGYHWQRQTNLFGFWRLLLQLDSPGPAWAVTKALWLSSVAIALIALTWTARAARIANDPATWRRWLTSAVFTMPLVMPYYMDYDLLLLAVPLTLVAADVIDAGGLNASHRWLILSCLGLTVALPFEPAAGQVLGVNVVTIAMGAVSFVLLRRVVPPRGTSVSVTPERLVIEPDVEYDLARAA